ncbi:transmembrane protein, putative (macronuclear) [Tetrahymena thermophila SB210]|uniref:Transmembrane protein, putative n=1 Tax=Tetrahymena thermophila (strain SB210) TaxID=312017 RepID=Q23RJ9_TETTS|nr:transmembrane protein, putative [Tetrahymena thermophila SB210]EAR99049.3 transmembrane protein, putative [Tetrahymena thermophila SB210]|eukprot:XP_001019294.3 transmembrane protein, putative [Tetrahymena thermophila SB210]
MALKIFNILHLIIILIQQVYNYQIRGQGHQISYIMSDTQQKSVLVYRFFVSFDIDVQSSDFLEVYFPIPLRGSNQNYPKYRIVKYEDASQYQLNGLEFYNQDTSKFQNCDQNGNNQWYYFQIQANLANQQLYVVELLPEPYTPLPALSSYTLDVVGFKVVSYPQQINFVIYSHSSNIATLNFYSPAILNQQYTQLNRISPNTFQVLLASNLNSAPDIVSQNGGYVVIKIIQTTGIQITIQSCSVSNSFISTDNLLLIIPFVGYSSQNLANIVLSSNSILKPSFSILVFVYSKFNTFYSISTSNSYILGNVLSSSSFGFTNNQNLIYKNLLYHWSLPKDANNEISIFVSSQTKYVYNKLAIQFSTDTNLAISDPKNEYFSISINLGSQYQILSGSFVNNFTPVSSDFNVICNVVNSLVVCPYINQLSTNIVYQISFKAIVFDQTQFNIKSISLIYNRGSISETIAIVSPSILNTIQYNFATNTDTTSQGTNQPWSSFLGDLQVISVPDIGTNTADTITQRAFYSTTANQGGGIFISRGVESVVFFLAINPQTLCNGNCLNLNKIIKMTMIANNNFFKFTNLDSSGLQLAAQNSALQSYTFSSLDCSSVTSGCVNGASNQAVDSNNYILNGKQVDSTHNIVKYTLRCGASGQASLPSQQCAKMFQGKEQTLGTYQNGFGGIFYIKQVDLSNSYIPSRVVADDQQLDFLITFSLEDPMNMSNAPVITLRTLINAYAISYYAADNIQYNANFINFSKNSQGLYNPSLFRLRVQNFKPNKAIIIFLDNSVELTSFINEQQATYSCQVITQSDTLANYNQNSCLAFKGAGALTSTNYILNNVIMINTNYQGLSYLEILIPLSPSQTNGLNPTVLHVGYGILIDSFNKGLNSLAIQSLISIKGVSSIGPSLQAALTSYFSITTLLNEDLTGQQKLYSYVGPAQSITFTANPSSTVLTFTDTTHLLNYGQIINDTQYKGAGILITSVIQDPFQDQVYFQSKSGTFPNQTGMCYKLSYYTSRQGENYNSPSAIFQYSIRYSVFCPFDDTNSPSLNPITVKNTQNPTNSPSQFILAIQSVANTVLAIAISEKQGRNIAQQSMPTASSSAVLNAQIAITSPSSGYNVNVNYAYPLNFYVSNFNLPMFLNQPLGISILVDNNLFQGKNSFVSVKVILNDQISMPCTFAYSANTLQISTTLNSAISGLQIKSLNIQTLFQRTDQTATLGSTTINFTVTLQYILQYYMNNPPEVLKIQQTVVSLNLASGSSPTVTATIDKPSFFNNIQGSRDILQFSFQLQNSNPNKVSIDVGESIQINLGFLRDPSKSDDNCQFFTDSTYQVLDHSIGYFSNYLFKFSAARPYTQKIFMQCYGVMVYKATANSYSVQYFNLLNVDMITTTNKVQELIQASWNLVQPKNGLQVIQVQTEFNEAGLNALDITIKQNPTNLPIYPQAEFYIYFPIEIDLNEFMFTLSLTSTTIYIPDKHALRVKVQSAQLIQSGNQYTLTVFPTHITNQLINAKNIRNLYIEYIDINSKSLLDYAYYSFSNINFSQFTERAPINIYITKASYMYGLQKATDQLNISFRVTNYYSAAGQNLKFIVYAKVGSQMNAISTTLSNTFNSNGILVFMQQNDISSSSDINIQIPTITNLKLKVKDLITIPIHICLFFNQNLVAITHNNISNLIGLPLLSSSNIFNQQYYSYFSDNEGDQIYVFPIYYNLIDKTQTFQLRELNGQSLQFRNPIINFQETDYIQCSDDIYMFKQDKTYVQSFQNIYLTKQQDTQLPVRYNLLQQPSSQKQSNVQFLQNTFKKCNVYSEYQQYFVKQGQNPLTIRIFLDDSCKILDPNFNSVIVAITVNVPGGLGTIIGSTNLFLSTDRVIIYQINVSNTATIGTQFNILYTVTNLPNISIQNTVIVPIQSNSLTLSLSSVTLTAAQNYLNLNLQCNENKLIYYELILRENKQSILANSALIQQAKNGAIKQVNQNGQVGKQSTHLIGSIQCNPQSASSLSNNFQIQWIRANTKYSINLLIDGTSSSTVYDFQTAQINTNPMLYLQIGIQQQSSLLTQQNPNLIRSQFLCYLAFYIGIPHNLIRFSEQPSVQCQQYLSSSYQTFATYPPNGSNGNEVCFNLKTDSQWHTFDNDRQYNFQFFPIEYGNDTSIFIEIDFSQVENQYLSSLKNYLNEQYQYLNNMNSYSTSQYINVCNQYTNLIPVQNYGNIKYPNVKVVKNFCSSRLQCNFYIQQTSGSSIIYLMISDQNLTESIVKTLSITQFKANSLNFLARYIYPLDENKTVQFNFTIQKPDKSYFAYYFLTDLTLQDYAYQFPGVYNETVIFITTYSATNLVLYLVIPLASVVLIAIIYFSVRYYRNRKKVQATEVKNQDMESNFEENQDLQDNGSNKADNILDDLKSEQRKGSIFGIKEKKIQCMKIVSKEGQVNLDNKDKKLKPFSQIKGNYKGKIDDIDEVILL